MKASKAIEILKKQKEYLKDVNVQTYEPWRNTTASYIKMFLGQTNEYAHIKDLGVIGFYPSHFDFENKIKENYVTLDKILDNCIETIQNAGLYKSGNFLTRMSEGWLIFLVTFSIPIIFFAGTYWGKYLSDTQNIELKRENKELKNKLPNSVSIPKNTDSIPGKKSDSDSKSH